MNETISASTIIKAPAQAIFAVLVDPVKHAAIDAERELEGWAGSAVRSTANP